MNKQELKSQYEEIKPSYEKTIQLAKAQLRKELEKDKIETPTIASRIKTICN